MRFFNQTLKGRDSYIYNNLMYGLLSHVTERLPAAMTSSWEELMTQHILQPLGMLATTFTHVIGEEEAKERLAVPYLYDEEGEWKAVSLTMHR